MGATAVKFEPWRVDYWFGMFWLVGSVAGSWGMVFWGHGVLAVVPAVWFGLKGWARVSRGLARERGIEVERRAIERFWDEMAPGEFGVQEDLLMVSGGICYGNVDLVVHPVWSHASFVIEIKSFPGMVRRWYGLCRVDKVYRLWSPQRQVRGQCRYLGRDWFFPVLWMPESKIGGWFVDDGILVVNGGVDWLIDGLRAFDGWIRKPVRVTFSWDPGSGYTGYMRGRGYVYDGGRYCWHGMENGAGFEALAGVLRDVGGRVEWLGR